MIVVNVGMALADVTGYASSTTAWMTHVGGLVFAWLYLHVPTGSGLERIRRHVSLAPDDIVLNPIPKLPRSVRQQQGEVQQAVNNSATESSAQVDTQQNALAPHRPLSAIPVSQEEKKRVDDVNALLDKISRYGIRSLTESERQLLEDVSRRLRNP
jgi:hypothetical protein